MNLSCAEVVFKYLSKKYVFGSTTFGAEHLQINTSKPQVKVFLESKHTAYIPKVLLFSRLHLSDRFSIQFSDFIFFFAYDYEIFDWYFFILIKISNKVCC